ncbi:MAG: putative rane protein [Schlesneria sp.]|nr:putative rane protein [Schlesneria sp.]
MTNSWLLLRVVELTITYLMHSTVFLGTVGIVLTVVACLRGRHGPSKLRQFNPIIEEQLWKLAATLPLFSIPLSIYAGSSYELSDEVFSGRQQPTSMTVAAVEPDRSVETAIVTNANLDASELEAPKPRPSSTSAADEGTSQFSSSTQIQAQVDNDSTAADFKTRRAGLNNQRIAAAVRDDGAFTSIDPRQLSTESTTSSLWHRWLGLALLSWIALAVVRLLVRAYFVERILNRCQPTHAELQRIMHRLTKQSGRIRLLTAPTNTVREPFACGIWRWTIVLPQGIEQQLTTTEVKALIAHEVAHLVRRDPLWLFVGELLCTALAIQPLNFIARRRWLQAAELLCDDWAIQQDVSAMSLAACLTRIAELRLDRRGETWGLAAVGRSGLLAHRVQWLLRDSRATEPKSRRSRLRTTAAIFALAILVGAFSPRFVLSTSAEAANVIDVSSEQIAIENELSAALDELEQAEKLLKQDQDTRTAVIASLLRLRIQSIRDRLRN